MVSIDGMVNLHLGCLKLEHANKIKSAISQCKRFENDIRMIAWSLKQM